MSGDSENKGKTKKRQAPPHAFKSGQSGNPGGRPKRTQEELDLVAACKDRSPAALDVIEQIMMSGQSDKARLSAAIAIIERGYGKAIQPQEISGAGGGPITINRIELVPLTGDNGKD
jgi:hypothetical protein